MNKKTTRQHQDNSHGEKPSETNDLTPKLDKIIGQLDLCMNILLEILFSNPQYLDEIPYTDKVVYLKAQGIESGDISKIVGRPSNWVSSRINDAKTRKTTKRKRRMKSAPKSIPLAQKKKIPS